MIKILTELDDILRFGTEDLFKDDENEENRIHYDDAAVENLLDRNQQTAGGEGEGEADGLNEYLSSFKVASYVTKEQDEDIDMEIIKEDSTETQDPLYWEKLLRHHYEQHTEDTMRTLGKGKRTRKPVNYNYNLGADSSALGAGVRDDAASSFGGDGANSDQSDYSIASGDDMGADDDDFDDPKGDSAVSLAQQRRRQRAYGQLGRDRPIPPLLARVGGNIEVLGFNARQRRAFLNSVMRFGMPPPDVFNSQWLSRDLKGKSEREFKAYSAMFMRHLCEPNNDANAATFADGVPREGLSRTQVLTRIGIMSLIRRKVQEFESINGHWSMPEMQQQQTGSGEGVDAKVKDEGEKSADGGGDQPAAMETSLTEMLAEATAAAKKSSSEEDKEAGTEEKSSSQKAEENAAGAADKSMDGGPARPGVSSKPSDVDKENSMSSNPITALKSTGKIKFVKQDKPEKLNSFKFMFNIADGGFTELHTLWLNEQRTVVTNKEYETWHRLHDYWLLSGIVTHGYSRWQDIQVDPRFSIIQEPFNKGKNPHSLNEL